ncbi:polypeptide composition of the spore coat protein CotJB [Lachnospiraceae bacterium KM106-2]|nr:polypeptide composition of the spore coat protein CotJB [Lachnospiraceae bacterium KM106-2]
MSERQSLMKEINEASFAIVDATLYLDTHPTDEAALQFFDEAMNKRKAAMQQYESKFEPLIIDCVNQQPASDQADTKYPGMKHWRWADGPAPWEGVC